MKRNDKLLLYSDNNPGSKREIMFSIDKGLIRMEKADFGSLVEEFYGDYDYEWIISDLPAKVLRKAMKVRTNTALIEKMKTEYNTSDAWERFSAFCYDNKLKYNIFIG